MATKDELKGLIALIESTYPSYKLEVDKIGNTILAFETLVGDIGITELTTAFISCTRKGDGRFAPSIPEIRNEVANLRMQKSGVPSVGDAWQEVYNSFVRMPGGNMSGGGSSPILDHPSVAETVKQMGGYAAIGLDYDNGQISFARSRFVKLYEEVVDRLRLDIAEHPMITAQTSGMDLIIKTDALGEGVSKLVKAWSGGKR